MNDQNPIFAYQQSSIQGASPVGQVVALYDTILRDFRRALAAIEAGNVETRVSETNHALTVIAHLENVLDHERGGEAAKHLKSFYQVTRGLIVQASVNSSRETLRKLIDLFSGLRHAWYQAELQSGANQPSPVNQPQPQHSSPRPPISTTQTSVPSDDSADTPRGNWSA
jgi:flagellar protein FliS